MNTRISLCKNSGLNLVYELTCMTVVKTIELEALTEMLVLSDLTSLIYL